VKGTRLYDNFAGAESRAIVATLIPKVFSEETTAF